MKKSHICPAVLFAVVFLVFAISIPQLPAQTLAWLNSTPAVPSRVTQVPSDSALTTLPGEVHPLARPQYDRGSVSDDQLMEHIILLLQRSPQQEEMLSAVIDGLHNRRSPLYHHWLTPEQFGRHFGPSDHDIAAVTSWLRSHGFSIELVSPGRTSILISGTAGQVREAFHTEIHNLNVNGEAHVANMSDPKVPTALAPVIGGFASLNNFFSKPLMTHVSAAGLNPGAGAHASRPGTLPDFSISGGSMGPLGAPANLVGPQDFYTIYNEKSLLSSGIDGAGVTIAVAERNDVCAGQSGTPCNGNNDANTFRSQFALPAYPPTPNNTEGGVNYLFGSGTATCTDPGFNNTSDEGEADIDLQWAGTVAPNATIDFVSCANSVMGTDGVKLAAFYIINSLSTTVSAISVSYGLCESEGGSGNNSYFNGLWGQAAAQGQTVIVAAGEQGSVECDSGEEYATHNLSVNGYGSSIYNVSAGGTDFSDTYQTLNSGTGKCCSEWWSSSNGTGFESALSYVPEITWGGECSSPLTASYLQSSKLTTWGTTYTPEGICNYSLNNRSGDIVKVTGGGGGYSVYNSIPTWQSVYGIGSSNLTSTSQRNMPDVSLFAATGFWGHALVYCQSDSYSCDFAGSGFATAGGTSFVAPELAGLMALVVQKTQANQGQANYTLYNLASQEYGTPGNPNKTNLENCSGSGKGAAVGATCTFYDIANDTPCLTGGPLPCNAGGTTITSDTAQPCEPGGTNNDKECYKSSSADTLGLTSASASSFEDAYQASEGYDLGTGIGSFNIANLVNNWNTVSPKFPTTTTITANPTSITNGGDTTLTATVTATGRGGFVAPLGNVNFYENACNTGVNLGSALLSSSCTGSTACAATASLIVAGSTLGVGSDTVFACFPGDGANDAASSGSTIVTVTSTGTNPSTTVVTSDFNPATLGNTVVYIATVSGTAGAPAGTVTFTDNGADIAGCVGVALSSSQAGCDETPTAGVHTIVANYSGSSVYAPGTGSLIQEVDLSSALQFFPLTPCRVVDTRNSDGSLGGPAIPANGSRSFPLQTSTNCAIPSTAVAYSLNVTAIPGSGNSLQYLTIWPTGLAQPTVSTLNSSDGRTKANAAIVPAGTDGEGSVSVYVSAKDATNVLLDINGYFEPAVTGSTFEFFPLTPCRVVDTRGAAGPLGGPELVGGAQRAFPVLSSSCFGGISGTPVAYSFNLTAVPPSGGTLSYLTIWPDGQAQPIASTLNDPTGTVVANAALVPAGTGGEVEVYASNNTNLLIDVNGYFATPASGGLSLRALSPCRVLDTRPHPFSNTLSPPVNAEATSCIAPVSSAQAFVFNATVVPEPTLGYLTLWPDGESRPAVSTLNADDGSIMSNMAIVQSLTAGDSETEAFAFGTTNLILDINAYFAP